MELSDFGRYRLDVKVDPSHFFLVGKISSNSRISYLQNLTPKFICIILTLPCKLWNCTPKMEMYQAQLDIKWEKLHLV